MTSLTILDSLPAGLLDCDARDLHRTLPGPTLVELPGREGAPLFVSVLQHGNETSGWEAIRGLLRTYQQSGLPRPMLLLLGNVSGAAQGLRRLDGQPDYNRVWPGVVEHADTPEAAVMAQVHDRVLARGAFAAIDLHNNTGSNPHYGVVCSTDAATLHLARQFAPIAVLFRGIPGTQTAAFAGKLPAIAAECGLAGDPANAAAAAQLVEAVLQMKAFPDDGLHPERLDLYHTLAVVKVVEGRSMSFDGTAADMRFDPALDRLNFRDVPAGTSFGHAQDKLPLMVTDEAEMDVTTDFFRLEASEVQLTRSAVPAMLSCDPRIVRQDCLCYLMEHIPAAHWSHGLDHAGAST